MSLGVLKASKMNSNCEFIGQIDIRSCRLSNADL